MRTGGEVGMNLANFRTDRNGNPYGLKKCKYHCDYGDGEYCHYKEIDGCIYNKTKEEKDDKHRKVGEESMGCVDTITAYKFPNQSELRNQ